MDLAAPLFVWLALGIVTSVTGYAIGRESERNRSSVGGELAQQVAMLQARSKDQDRVISQQAFLIRQFREDPPSYEPRRCYCTESRWRAWMEGTTAGEDGIVHTSDDDLLPKAQP